MLICHVVMLTLPLWDKNCSFRAQKFGKSLWVFFLKVMVKIEIGIKIGDFFSHVLPAQVVEEEFSWLSFFTNGKPYECCIVVELIVEGFRNLNMQLCL